MYNDNSNIGNSNKVDNIRITHNSNKHNSIGNSNINEIVRT